MSIKSIVCAAILILGLGAPAFAQGITWLPYHNQRLGFSIALPLSLFHQTETKSTGVSLVDDVDSARLDVFGSTALKGLTPPSLMSEVKQAGRIGTVTYRKDGAGWFVLSGYYRRDANEQQDLIFYAKFMFNADRTAFWAFEISYPVSEKRAFNGIVTHLEKSLRAPR